MIPPQQKQLIDYLKRLSKSRFDLIPRLKIVYRPYICPIPDLLQLIEDGDSVFDIGCGNGAFLACVAGFRRPSKLGGIEIRSSLVENANLLLSKIEQLVPVEIQLYNGLDLPSSIDTYDIILMCDVFHHIPENNQCIFLENLFRSMSTGSVLIMKDIDEGSKPMVYMNKIHDLILSGESGNEKSIDWMAETLHKIGFEIDSIVSKRVLWYPHYTIIAKKN